MGGKQVLILWERFTPWARGTLWVTQGGHWKSRSGQWGRDARMVLRAGDQWYRSSPPFLQIDTDGFLNSSSLYKIWNFLSSTQSVPCLLGEAESWHEDLCRSYLGEWWKVFKTKQRCSCLELLLLDIQRPGWLRTLIHTHYYLTPWPCSIYGIWHLSNTTKMCLKWSYYAFCL